MTLASLANILKRKKFHQLRKKTGKVMEFWYFIKYKNQPGITPDWLHIHIRQTTTQNNA